MDLAEKQAQMWARHNRVPKIRHPQKLTPQEPTRQTGARKGRARIDLSKLRFQVEAEDKSHYNVWDSLTGLCFTVCPTETAARRRALELNKFTGNYAGNNADAAHSTRETEPTLVPCAPREPTMRELRQARRHAAIERRRRLLFIPRKIKHFWANVNMTFGNCWVWTGAQAAHGYGQYSVGRAHIMAHRYAYIVSRGPVPAGHQITHSCGVRLCMNPDHLMAMTAKEREAMQRAKRQHK
jgi:HNH endonuclease